MNGKAAFIAGAAVGYLLGTRAGREQYEKMKSGAKSALDHPAVKDKVAKAETAITDAVQKQGAKVTDQVASMVKERFTGSTGSPSSAGSSPTGTPPAANGTSNGPASAWDTPQR